MQRSIKQTFGTNLRTARENAGLTQDQLAEKFGVSGTSISKWEKGLYWPSGDMVDKLATELNIEPEQLFTPHGLALIKGRRPTVLEAMEIVADYIRARETK